MFKSQDIKLDFNDVLILPKFSSLDTRSSVVLSRNLIMPHSEAQIRTTGIIAANMDGVGTIEVATVLTLS